MYVMLWHMLEMQIIFLNIDMHNSYKKENVLCMLLTAVINLIFITIIKACLELVSWSTYEKVSLVLLRSEIEIF